VENLVKEIALTQGKVALVDDEDYEKLVAMGSWHAREVSRDYWIARTQHEGKSQMMHRVILNAPIGLEVDHINHNTLDNRRCNIRLCTHAQNGRNRLKSSGTSSKHKGVHWFKPKGYWQAKIKVNGEWIFLGYFDDEDAAGRAYNIAARQHFGEFALLNVV